MPLNEPPSSDNGTLFSGSSRKIDPWCSEAKAAIETIDQVKHSYRLTPPELSPAQEVVQLSTQISTTIDRDPIYQLSNIPYLLLVTFIFLINGLILFFGPTIRNVFLNESYLPASHSNILGSTWPLEEESWEQTLESNWLQQYSTQWLPLNSPLTHETIEEVEEKIVEPPEKANFSDYSTNLFR